RPLVLLFGSYSSPALRGEIAEFNQMHRDYGDRVAILLIYLQEAHSVDGWQMPENVDDEVLVRNHGSMDERLAAARRAIGSLKIEFAVAVDSFDNRTERAYTAWPARTYLIDSEGRIARKGPPGPFGFNSKRMEAVLKALLESKKVESPQEHARVGSAVR
ncbi:MAG: deiodinase-like protein, partial [Bryobacteraceae bacterium]